MTDWQTRVVWTCRERSCCISCNYCMCQIHINFNYGCHSQKRLIRQERLTLNEGRSSTISSREKLDIVYRKDWSCTFKIYRKEENRYSILNWNNWPMKSYLVSLLLASFTSLHENTFLIKEELSCLYSEQGKHNIYSLLS